MPDNPTSNKPSGITFDHERGVVHIPGKGELPLIRPITQRIDKDGRPYQHQASVDELVTAEKQHDRTMRFIRDAMRANWRCTQCRRVCSGKDLKASDSLMDLLTQMLSGPHRVDWNSIVENLGDHLRCKDPLCKAPCVRVELPS